MKDKLIAVSPKIGVALTYLPAQVFWFRADNNLLEQKTAYYESIIIFPANPAVYLANNSMFIDRDFFFRLMKTCLYFTSFEFSVSEWMCK